jgi:hypothetical protein
MAGSDNNRYFYVYILEEIKIVLIKYIRKTLG